MPSYRLTGNYGTFEVSRVIEAPDEDEAWCETGIKTILEAAGWSVDGPDGEDWEIEPVGHAHSGSDDTDVIEALHSAHIRAEIEWVGGGLEVIRVPLSGDGRRYACFGRGTTLDEAENWPFWNGPDDPPGRKGQTLIAWGYRDVGDDNRLATKDPVTDVIDDLVGTFYRMLHRIHLIPLSDYREE